MEENTAINKKAIEKYWLIWANAIIIFLGWLGNITLPIFFFLCIEVAIILMFSKNTIHLFAPLWMFYYAFTTTSINLDGKFMWFLILLIPLFGLIVHIVRFRPSVFAKENLKRGFILALIFACFSIAIGGIGVSGRNNGAVGIIVALCVIIPIVYLFMFTTLPTGKDVAEYIAMIMFVVSALLVLQLIVYYSSLGSFEVVKSAISAKQLKLGWGSSNNFDQTVSLGIPVAIYYSLKKSKVSFLYLIYAAFIYVLVLICSSRGVILIDSGLIVIMIIYAFIKTKNRLQTGITVGIIVLTGIIVIAVLKDRIYEVFHNVIDRGLSNNGRFSLYLEGISYFKTHPFFGVGLDYHLGGLKGNTYTPYWYHSTPIQVLTCMGIVGVIAFSVFYFWRYRTFLLSRKSPLIMAIMCGLLIYDLYSWIDVGFFPPNSFIIMLIMTIAADKFVKNEKQTAFLLV